MQGDVQCYRPIAYSARGENDELKCWNNERGNVFMRCLLVVVFVAILLAAADLIRADSPAEAAGGGYASRCGGGKRWEVPRNRHRCLCGRLQRLQDYHVYYGLWCPR
jgi:hypothetical protein